MSAKRLLVVLAAASVAAGVLLVRAGPSRAVDRFAVVNGTVIAGADHVRAGSNAFPNFATGAFDNYYPYAHAHVDSSPFSQGRASPVDSGPIGQTIVAAFNAENPPQTLGQPQYVDARYPPGEKKPLEVGSRGGPYAQSFARENYAFAQSSYAGDTAEQPEMTHAAALGRLDAALMAWRALHLTPGGDTRYPAVHAQADEPDTIDGGTSVSTARFDEKAGALVTTADTRVARAVLGGGSIVIRGMHTSVTITNTGTPKAETRIEVAHAEIGGMPVEIGADGVSIAGQAVPGLVDTVQQASAALNDALAQGGFALRSVAPTIAKSANQQRVDATAVHVEWHQPPSGAGVPQQSVEHSLAEVFADSLALPVPSVSSVKAPSTGGAPTGGGPRTEFIPGTSGSPGPSGRPALTGGPGTTGTPAASVVERRPRYLLLLYFMWQSLLVGTAASLWWRRQEMKAS